MSDTPDEPARSGGQAGDEVAAASAVGAGGGVESGGDVVAGGEVVAGDEGEVEVEGGVEAPPEVTAEPVPEAGADVSDRMEAVPPVDAPGEAPVAEPLAEPVEVGARFCWMCNDRVPTAADGLHCYLGHRLSPAHAKRRGLFRRR